MQPTKHIEHQGIVSEVEGNRIKVNIVSQSACSSCHAKGACGMSEVQEKTIEVEDNSGSYRKGEWVNVILEQTLGYRALFLGYLLPFLVVLFTLILTISISGNEALSGILSLTILLPYYLVLFLMKGRIQRSFSFMIKKLA
ncbi:MAG TPA: SoxR reducing system RseC family protein [Bacteroidales bacterium]|nr:SoxR reducing system RseC family protein [Bacteroidales bacterium]